MQCSTDHSLRALPHVLLACGIMLFLASCRGVHPLDTPYAGRATAYGPGALAFDIEATPDTAGVQVWVGIPPVSLIFRQEWGVFVARYSLELDLRDDASDTLVASRQVVDTLQLASAEAASAYRPYLKRYLLDAPPGLYKLHATLRDNVLGRAAQHALRIRVPEKGTLALSNLQVEAQLPGDTLRPLVSLHVPARPDTLRASVSFADLPEGQQGMLTLVVVRFEADTLAASLPFGYNGPGSLAYRGVRLEKPDTMQIARQPLRDAAGHVEVEFGLPRLSPGLYRIEVQVDGLGEPIRRERVLAVKSSDFPRVRTMDEMVAALQYLLTRREARRFREAATPEAQRVLFDAFWARTAQNRDAAAARMRRYYARVEEANLRYSAYKAGWKTDRGMVYIVLGAPRQVDTWPDREVWYYATNEADEAETYVFERVRAYDAETPFIHYVLERTGAHQRHWQRALDRWRRGD